MPCHPCRSGSGSFRPWIVTGHVCAGCRIILLPNSDRRSHDRPATLPLGASAGVAVGHATRCHSPGGRSHLAAAPGGRAPTEDRGARSAMKGAGNRPTFHAWVRPQGSGQSSARESSSPPRGDVLYWEPGSCFVYTFSKADEPGRDGWPSGLRHRS